MGMGAAPIQAVQAMVKLVKQHPLGFPKAPELLKYVWLRK